jgi:hypothetical protein
LRHCFQGSYHKWVHTTMRVYEQRRINWIYR